MQKQRLSVYENSHGHPQNCYSVGKSWIPIVSRSSMAGSYHVCKLSTLGCIPPWCSLINSLIPVVITAQAHGESWNLPCMPVFANTTPRAGCSLQQRLEWFWVVCLDLLGHAESPGLLWSTHTGACIALLKAGWDKIHSCRLEEGLLESPNPVKEKLTSSEWGVNGHSHDGMVPLHWTGSVPHQK